MKKTTKNKKTRKVTARSAAGKYVCVDCEYPAHKINLDHCPLCKECEDCSEIVRKCKCIPIEG